MRGVLSASTKSSVPAAWQGRVIALPGNQVERGEIQVRHGEDAASLVRVLVDVARLELGEHTSASVVAHISGPALAERLRQLQRDHAELDAQPWTLDQPGVPPSE